MNELAEFRQRADEHGICEMAQQWDAAGSKRKLIDLALSARGMEYIAASTAEGWGLSADYIAATFAPFNNARYIRDADGYTSALYCQTAQIDIVTTAALIVYCNAVINVNRFCELHIVNSKVKLTGNGKANIHLYNSEVTNATIQTRITRH